MLRSQNNAMELFLQEAAELVTSERQKDYGTPSENHGRTAEFWNLYLGPRLKKGELVSPIDVCILNMLQKISRLSHSMQRDGLLDIAGYAANAEACRISQS